MNLKKGEYTTRTFIWKNIYSYIVKNNLASDSDKRNIILDTKEGTILKELLDLKLECNNIYSIRKNIENLIIKE